MKKIILTGAFGIAMVAASAQQLPLYSQYFSNPFIYNPSFTGMTDDTKAFLMHKSQWKDMPGAPVTSLLSVDGPIREKNVGLGLTLFNDVTDITERMGAYTSYSYKIKIDEDNTIRAGLAVGVLVSKIDFTKVIVKDVNDPFLMRNIERKASFDANLGVGYIWKALEVGFSIPQLVGNKVSYVNSESSAYYQLNRHFLASAKYTFDVVKDKGMTVYPLVMVRTASGAPVQYDINAVFDWANMGWAGISYRSNYAIGLNLGVRLNNTLSAGYAYDLSIGPIGSYSGGAHEIMLSYTFGKKESSSAPVAITDETSKTDALTDSMLLVLKKNDISQRAEIESLKGEINELKKQQLMNTPVTPADTATGFMKTGLSTEFKDEQGNRPEAGYMYVVIGSFKQPENAQKAKKKYLEMGYIETQTIFNEKNGFTYVFVVKTNQADRASTILGKVRESAADSWIMTLQ
jgi:type IX secretion system PorP/SprF family membrane protein